MWLPPKLWLICRRTDGSPHGWIAAMVRADATNADGAAVLVALSQAGFAYSGRTLLDLTFGDGSVIVDPCDQIVLAAHARLCSRLPLSLLHLAVVAPASGVQPGCSVGTAVAFKLLAQRRIRPSH
jgi:hypothetical protein